MCTCNLQWRTKLTLTLHLKLNLNNSWQQMLIIYTSFHKDHLYCQFSHRHHNFKFWIVLCENCKQICIHCKALHCYKRINSHEYAKQPSTTMIRTKASSIWFYIMHNCILPSPQQNFQTVIKVGKILKYMSHNFCLVCSDFTCF